MKIGKQSRNVYFIYIPWGAAWSKGYRLTKWPYAPWIGANCRPTSRPQNLPLLWGCEGSTSWIWGSPAIWSWSSPTMKRPPPPSIRPWEPQPQPQRPHPRRAFQPPPGSATETPLAVHPPSEIRKCKIRLAKSPSSGYKEESEKKSEVSLKLTLHPLFFCTSFPRSVKNAEMKWKKVPSFSHFSNAQGVKFVVRHFSRG